MSDIDQEILNEFLAESQSLVTEGQEILETLEDDLSQPNLLMDYANRIDRVMGAAKSLAMLTNEGHALHLVGDCTELCKALSYRAVKQAKHQQLLEVTVSFLLDANEIVGQMLNRINEPAEVLRKSIQTTLMDRLKWIIDVSNKIPETKQAAGPSLGQSEIDDIMKKLGMG